MSKHKTSAKKLIIEDDEQQDDGCELNPFSFKEFIRTKNQYSNTEGHLEGKNHLTKKKTHGSAYVADDSYTLSNDFDIRHKGHFFTNSKSVSECLESEPDNEEEWTESYQPSAVEEAHELGLCGTLDNSTFFDQLSLAGEEKDETANEWQSDEEISPKIHTSRKSTGSYEGDEETSIADLSFHLGKNSGGDGRRDQHKLREENSQLRKHIKELLKKSEADSVRIEHLTDELHKRKLQEEREAKTLETMVQSVEQNLQSMTKRAVKAENSVSKLKQEVHQLQSQLEGYKSENERLRASETAALNTMRHNAQLASEYLSKAAQEAETSIKQLLTGTETLCLASQLLSSIDKISEIHK
ncbi:endosome-associated-trafficking regulator 1 [Chanos chanos]|uniref:Endosome-associated-trafficking regulator 1 n=1 Tax=Chanos chanos TaxID=29144 RepID=A0A6J2WU76_CHACN|nr:endosome-associated-trafficking regulator 1 [Chanos chanos]